MISSVRGGRGKKGKFDLAEIPYGMNIIDMRTLVLV